MLLAGGVRRVWGEVTVGVKTESGTGAGAGERLPVRRSGEAGMFSREDGLFL